MLGPFLLIIKTRLKFERADEAARQVIFDITRTAQKMKFSIKDFFSKCDQIRSFLRIWSHLLKKSFMENFIFCAVTLKDTDITRRCKNELRNRFLLLKRNDIEER